MSTWWGDSKNIEEIEFSRWFFEGRPRQGKNVLPDGLNWLCYFAGSSKSHHENSISCIFLESPHHEERCQMLQTLFWLFQCSKNPQWQDIIHYAIKLIAETITRSRRHRCRRNAPVCRTVGTSKILVGTSFNVVGIICPFRQYLIRQTMVSTQPRYHSCNWKETFV